MQDGRDGDEEIGYIGNIQNSATAGFKYFDIQGVREFALQQEDMQMAILRCEMKLMGKCLRNYTLFIQMYGKIMKRKFQYRMVYSHCTLLFRGQGNASLKSFALLKEA